MNMKCGDFWNDIVAFFTEEWNIFIDFFRNLFNLD